MSICDVYDNLDSETLKEAITKLNMAELKDSVFSKLYNGQINTNNPSDPVWTNGLPPWQPNTAGPSPWYPNTPYPPKYPPPIPIKPTPATPPWQDAEEEADTEAVRKTKEAQKRMRSLAGLAILLEGDETMLDAQETIKVLLAYIIAADSMLPNATNKPTRLLEGNVAKQAVKDKIEALRSFMLSKDVLKEVLDAQRVDLAEPAVKEIVSDND